MAIRILPKDILTSDVLYETEEPTIKTNIDCSESPFNTGEIIKFRNPVNLQKLEDTIDSQDHLTTEQALAQINQDLPFKSHDENWHLTTEGALAQIKSSTYAFLTGVAGAGKSYTLLQGISSGAIKPCIAATTGIAAVNLGTQTINSWLKYFDTFSLKQNRYDGKLKRYINSLASEYDSLVIDEVSMMDKDQLDLIYSEIEEMNHDRRLEGKNDFRLLVTGDALQLSPVPNKNKEGKNLPLPWFFQADCWNKFEENTIKLTKVWRQSNPLLLDALNAIRRGDGKLGAELLLKAGIEFSGRVDPTFQGTTLIAKNAEVDKYNSLGLMRVEGETKVAFSRSWFSGMKPPSDWKNIPGPHNAEMNSLKLKKGAYVMILANDSPTFSFVNGDCGIIKDWGLDAEGNIETVLVELARGGEVTVGKIVRDQLSPEAPGHLKESEITVVRGCDKTGYCEEVIYNTRAKRYVVGQIEYLPIRLGYASTVHKSQGLSLPFVQIDINSYFMGSPAMIYVALSRAQTVEGVRIVGNAKMLGEKVKIDEAVRRFV